MPRASASARRRIACAPISAWPRSRASACPDGAGRFAPPGRRSATSRRLSRRRSRTSPGSRRWRWRTISPWTRARRGTWSWSRACRTAAASRRSSGRWTAPGRRWAGGCSVSGSSGRSSGRAKSGSGSTPSPPWWRRRRSWPISARLSRGSATWPGSRAAWPSGWPRRGTSRPCARRSSSFPRSASAPSPVRTRWSASAPSRWRTWATSGRPSRRPSWTSRRSRSTREG